MDIKSWEWSGDEGTSLIICFFHFFSLSSSSWKNVPAARRKELLEGDDVGREDGEFWMSYQDFKKHFTDFEVCNISIDQLYEDENGKWCDAHTQG